MRWVMRLGRRSGILAALLVVGCGGVGEADHAQSDPSVSSDRFAVNSAVPTLPILGLLKAVNGNAVTFYDTGDGVLISEQGAPPSRPALRTIPTAITTDVAAIWTYLAPGEPVPAAVTAAQNRKVDGSSNSDTNGGTEIVLGGGRPVAASRTAQPDTPDGCNNGCCDSTWLVNTFCDLQGSWDWFLPAPQYWWSHAQSTNNAFTSWAGECSAVGWSHFVLTIRGTQYAWYVPEAHYQSNFWVAGTGFFGQWLTGTVISNVNQDYPPTPSTNCGEVGY
jgi:hypothetical protein